MARRFAGQAVREADLAAAIDEERAVLAELTAGGLIRGMGYEKRVSVGMTEAERLQKAFDQLFDLQEGEKVPALSGIREAYAVATHDYAVTGVHAPGAVAGSGHHDLDLLLPAGHQHEQAAAQGLPGMAVASGRSACTITPIKDFKLQNRVRLGAFGSLSTVAEDTAYTTHHAWRTRRRPTRRPSAATWWR